MSNVQAALKQKALEVPQGSFRHSVLQAARRFKASWAELGKLLVRVRNEALFQEWGFESFEAYCWKEIRIRKATADKLTRGFSFLERHEPKLAANDEALESEAPPFELVEVLAGAEDRGQLSADEYRSIRDSIWNEERPVAEVRKELNEKYPRPVPDVAEDAALKRVVALARKLTSELRSVQGVPRAMVDRAEALAEELAGLV